MLCGVFMNINDLGVLVDINFFVEYKKVYPAKQKKIPRRRVPVFGDFIQQEHFQDHFIKSQKELEKLNDEVQKRFIY